MTNFLETALACAARGWYAFPLKPRDKYPVISKKDGGRGFYDATLDPEQLKTWWTTYPPMCNVGIACGVSDLYVVDADKGLTSEEEFQAWRMRNGIPVTYTVRTGRRTSYAVQMYYTGALECNGKWELDGVSGEIRSTGGLVMAVGNIHPDTGEVYQLLVDAPLAPRPACFELAVTAAKVAPVAGEPITKLGKGEGRHPLMISVLGGYHRAGLTAEAALAAITTLNDTHFTEPIPVEELEETVKSCYAKWKAPEKVGTVSIGPGKIGAEDVEEVEELDKALRATPLPDYPLSAFDDTLYMEFAKRAAAGNFVPLEFFIEGAMTYAGAMAGCNLMGQEETITPRLYTVLLANAGFGKGTTFRRLRRFAPPDRMMSAVIDSKGQDPNGSRALLARAASEPALNDALLMCNRVCLDFEEMDRMMEKTEIKGSGGALMSVIRTCFDDIHPGITTTSERTEVAEIGYLSLLGAMTPSIWRRSMEGRDSYGSGLGGRFNLIATNTADSASELLPMDASDLMTVLDGKLAALEAHPLTIPTEREASAVLREWWLQSKGQTHYNRVNVIAHRKALHLAWIRGMPVITAELMRQAVRLADYLVGVRDAFAVTKGEDRTAIGENRVMHILQQISPKWVRARKVVELLDGLMSRASVYRALESLVNSGEAEKVDIDREARKKGERPYTIYRDVVSRP
jgi:hypothetical protein